METGVAIDAPGWFAFYAPARTTTQMVERLEMAIAAAAATPELRTKMKALGFQPTEATSKDLERIQRVEFDAWGVVVRESGFKP